MTVQILIFIFIICLIARGVFQLFEEERPVLAASDGYAQTTGNKEIQADAMWISTSGAGKMAVLADGIGKENTGKICADLAVNEFSEAFSLYKVIHNPRYFIERTFYSLHMNMQKVLEERQGGASVGVIFLNDGKLYYAMAGQIKIILWRAGELIPLSEGQTVSVLARKAYKDGKLGRQETIWSMHDKDIWNYVGKDGFHQIEISEIPIQLKRGDLAVMMTKGIFEEVSLTEIEKILSLDSATFPPQEKADRIVRRAEASPREDKDNGSFLVLLTEGAMR